VPAVIVTGATRGVGRAFAVALARSGAQLVVNGRDPALLDDLVAALRTETPPVAGVVGVAGSVADESVAAALVERCVTEYGRVDALVNNAGVVRDRSALKMTTEDFDDVIATDLRGAWLCGRHAAAAMKDTGGSIVNIVSEVAFYGAFGQSNYMAAKAGLTALTLAWSQEFRRYRIRVNAVSPAALTDMSRVVLDRAQAANPSVTAADLGIGRPDDIAPLVVFLAGDASRAITGQVYSFNGRRLDTWSFPQVAASATAPSWTPDSIAAALDVVGTDNP
jgi:3-oxoacyl-[acyl-carrier protein] reductase